jgi:hypothetical protein
MPNVAQAPAAPRRSSGRNLAAAVCLALLPLPAALASGPELEAVDRLRLAFGGYRIDNSLIARVDEVGGLPGDPVDFRRDLGFERREDTALAEIDLRLGDRHRLAFRGYRLEREVDQALLRRDVRFEGQDFSAGARIDSRLRLQREGLDYTWLALAEARRAAGVGVGLLHYRLSARLDAEGLDDLAGTRVQAEASESAWAPLLRAEYRQVLGQRWRLHGEAAWVRKPSGSLSGDALEAAVGLEWFLTRRFGLGLRYAFSDIDVEVDKRDFAGRAQLRQHGPQLLLVWRLGA